MVLPDSRGVSRDPHYLGTYLEAGLLSPTGLSPAMAPLIQRYSARRSVCNLTGVSYCSHDMSHNPPDTTGTTYHIPGVWADPRSLATTSGVAFCFTFLEVLRCFNSLGWLYRPMYSVGNHLGLPGGVSPFGNPRVSLLPTNRGLSQVATSFIASRCQGIHHTPLLNLAKNPRKSQIRFGWRFVQARIAFLAEVISKDIFRRTWQSAVVLYAYYPCIQLSKNM